MVPIGINGFGRIGKSLFIQLITNKKYIVKAINAPNFDIKMIESYLKNDSVHKYDIGWEIKIINDNSFLLNNNLIHVFNNRDAKKLTWNNFGIDYVIDATGSYLTKEKAKDHNVKYVIMCAPPKDNTPLFVYNVNHTKYNGENIVSNASCTTNCITPVLKFLDDNYGIANGNFTTIHSATASQTTVDTINSNNRTHRSILNNIIPHTTGASSSIFELIPSLTDKIYGTSLRVPVSNVSIVDLNVELNKDVLFNDLISEMKKDSFIQVINDNLVSSDFLTTTCPSIVDLKASMHLGGNRFKLMIWYDNEWSYTAQVIRLLDSMVIYNTEVLIDQSGVHKYFIDNYNYYNKRVVIRVDWNIPTKDFKIKDDFRIVSSLKTIERVLIDNPKRVVIISHFGRPEGKDLKYSWKHYMEQIKKYFTDSIYLLENGLSLKTLDDLKKNEDKHKLYLLENIRFHDEEINYKKYPDNNLQKIIIQQLGDFYVNDAFGCCHRDHLSICGIDVSDKSFGYLIQQEIDALDVIMKNPNNEKILAIIGGGKMEDKLPLIISLSKKMNDIYIGGGNINSIIKDNMTDYLEKIKSNRAKIHLMKDGLSTSSIDVIPIYCATDALPDDHYFYDIGMDSMFELEKLIMENDIIFLQGVLGVVENKLYEAGSINLINVLIKSGKKVIVGGGDTACFVNKFNHNFHYISSGGGSTIDYISNGSLVGIDFFN
jgi:glyceraldehyde 3-phosphate dehydrogenase